MPQFRSNVEAFGLDSQEMLDSQFVFRVVFAQNEILKYDSQSLILSVMRSNAGELFAG